MSLRNFFKRHLPEKEHIHKRGGMHIFSDYLHENTVTFIGSGVFKTTELIKHPNAVFIQNKLPSARDMGQLAYAKYKKNDIEDVAYFEPFYLKDFIVVPQKKKI